MEKVVAYKECETIEIPCDSCEVNLTEKEPGFECHTVSGETKTLCRHCLKILREPPIKIYNDHVTYVKEFKVLEGFTVNCHEGCLMEQGSKGVTVRFSKSTIPLKYCLSCFEKLNTAKTTLDQKGYGLEDLVDGDMETSGSSTYNAGLPTPTKIPPMPPVKPPQQNDQRTKVKCELELSLEPIDGEDPADPELFLLKILENIQMSLEESFAIDDRRDLKVEGGFASMMREHKARL